MDFSQLINIVIKLGSIALMAVYIIFAFVVVRQTKLMVRTFSTAFEQKLKLISWLHLITAVIVFILALVI